MLRLIDTMESSKTVDSSVSMTSDVRPIAPNIIEPIETIYNGLQSDIDINDIIIYQFGEVDCRCHIGKQLLLNRDLNDIIEDLISKYIDSININLKQFSNSSIKIIICSIPPTMDKEFYEKLHGPITHEFPFVGDNIQRSIYTKLMNNTLKKYCNLNNFYY